MLISNIKNIGKSIFLTPNIKKTLNHLKQMLIKASIFWHFNLEKHIQIETNISSYSMSGVLSQLNLNFNAVLNNLNKSDFS